MNESFELSLLLGSISAVRFAVAGLNKVLSPLLIENKNTKYNTIKSCVYFGCNLMYFVYLK